MNKVYKVVWNASLGAWVAVSELAKGKVKGSNGKVGGISTVEESNEKSHSETINLKTLSLAVITIVAPNWVYAGTEVSGTPTKSGSNITNINTCTASATTTNGVAIGCSSIAGAKDSVIADRSNPYNTSTSNSRVTFDTTSGGNTAIGTGASAGNANQGLATAIGTYATANNVAAVAIGAAALSTGNTSLSIGRQSAATADYAQAIGNVAAATGTGALAIGHSATATGYRGIAIGSPDIDNASVVAGQAGAAYQTVGQTKASGRDAIAFGGGSQSLKDEGMTIGAFSGATEQGAAVVGVRGAALGQQSLSIGNGATKVESGTNTPVSLTKSLGAGTSNNKTVGARIFTVTNSISETKGNTAGTLTGTVDGVAITITQAAGTGNSTTGTVGAITGGSYNGQTLSAEQAKALYQSLGHSGSVTLGSQSIAIGTATSALANNALALGSTSLASGNGSVAIGSGSTATKTDAVSIGRGAGSSVVSGVAIGAEAKVQGDNSIALGQKSVASAQINSSFLTNVDATTQGTISVGSETDNIKRRLTNLADGAVDSDGVTVAQLKQFKVLTDKQGSDTAAALGGGSAYNATTGAITLPTYNVGGTTQTTVAGAITNIDNRTTSLENQTWKLNTNSDTATTVGKDVEVKFSDGKNIKITRTGTNVTIATTDSAAFDSITTGNSKLDNNGLVVKDATGGVSVSKDSIKFVNADGTTQTANSPSLNKTGINAGNQKITNIADGSLALGSKEAVNGGQLTSAVDAATDTAATTLVNVLGGNAAYDATTNTFTAPNNIGGTGKNTIDEAISSVKGAAETPMTFVGNARNSGDTKDVERKLGESLTISGAATTAGSYSGKNVRTVTDQTGSIAIELADNLDVTSVTAGDSTLNNNGLSITGGPSITKTGGINAGGSKITNVGNATTASDAVNKGQLDSSLANANSNAAVVYTDAAGNKVTKAADGKWYAATDVNADGSLIGSPIEVAAANIITSVQNASGSTTTATKLGNVAAGSVTASSTDAINGSQLYNTANNVKNIIGSSAAIDTSTGVITTSNIGGTGSSTIDGAITEVSKSAKAAKTTVTAGENVEVTSTVDSIDGHTNYIVKTAKDVSFDKVTVGNVVIDKSTNTIAGLSNKDLTAADFATQGRAATEEQLKQVISSNITEVVDGNGNKVNIIDQVVNTKPDNKNQDSLFLTYDKQGQETTDRLTIAQTVQKMNTEGVKFFHTNADTSKGDLGTTNDSSAGGLNSTAVGVNAIVETDAVSALAVGHNTKAGGAQSIAIGNGAEALGTQSISIGTGNKVTGDHSGAIGDPTIVDGSNSYSVGNNNQVLTDDTFVLGNNVTQTVTGSVVLGTGSAATTGAGVAGYALSTATTADKTAISNTTSTTGAVAIGDAANGIYRQITGVAAGSQDSDAVNVAQLKAVGNQVTTTQTSLVNSLGGNAKVNADGSITGPTYNVAQGTQTNVGDALTALDQAIGNAATTSKTTVSNGENIVVSKTKNADGSDNYQVSTAKDLTVDSIKAGETVLNNAGIAIANNAVVLNNTGLVIAGGPSVTTQGINAGSKTIQNVADAMNATDAVNKGQLDSAINNVNNNVNQLANNAVKYDDATKDKITLGGANGTTISNVKDGTVAQGSKEAVNGGQLWNVQQQVNQNTSDIENIQTNINNINNGKSGLVQQQTPNGDITIGKDTGGTKVSVAGKDGDRVVTGVKDGVISATSKDAVNGSQLNVTNNKVVEFLGGGAGYDNITNSFTNPTYTVGGKEYNNVGGAVDALNKADQALDSKIDNVSNRLEQAFYSTNQRIDDVEKRANAGIAAAMALEAAPFVAGKYTYAAGASYHGGENAVGVTLRKTADNGRWSITGGVAAASQGDPSVRIGISGVID